MKTLRWGIIGCGDVTGARTTRVVDAILEAFRFAIAGAQIGAFHSR